MTVCSSCGQETPDDFRFCGACGAELVSLSGSARQVRKTVTVLFCDLVGYTSTSERLDPEALRRLQSRYFEDARAALERHGGTVEKFIGDAVMAVFGVPHVHEDDALRALKAAIDLKQVVADLDLQARIGINTGEVVAGTGDALVTGDAVNTAARLEQAAPAGEILIGAQTFRLCRDAAEVEAVEPLDLKGKGDAVVAYRLTRVLEGAPAHQRRHDGAMVGRTRELLLLRQAFDRAVSERGCHLFTVLGPAGVGKSRLAEELVAGTSGDATVLTGRCLSYGEAITYWPLVEVFHQARADDDLEEALSRPMREETSWAVRVLLERWARERPLVLVLDDLHWAEPTFLDLVEHVADLSRDAPILLLCLARPELLDIRPTWGGGKMNATAVLLEALTVSESQQLIADLAGERPLDERIRRRIVEAAEGNPLFVEEMLAMVAEEHADQTDIEVPATIQALLAARLERLHPAERRVLEHAAVEGKVFHGAAVADLAPSELRPDIPAHLVSLVRKELIRPEEGELPGEDAFGFRHQLIRDAAYQSLPKEERAGLHERFAAWLERATEAGALELDEIVGYHLEQAHRYRAELGTIDDAARGLVRRAAGRLARAGGRALGRSDMPAAVNLLGRAAALFEPDDPDRIEILPELGAALGEVGDLAQAEVVLAQAVEEARALGAPGPQARAEIARILLLAATDTEWSAQEASAQGERIIVALEGSGDDRTLAKAWSLVGQAPLFLTHYAEMDRVMSRSLEHAERADDLQQRSEAIVWLAVAVASGPTRVEEGIARLERLRERVSEGSHAEAGLLVNLAKLHAMAGRLEQARTLVGRGRAIFKELGMEVSWAAFAMEQAWVELHAGDPAVAEPALREACETLQRMGERSFLSTVAALLAETLSRLERHEEADGWTHVSEEAASPDDIPSQVLWRSVRAKGLARGGEFEDGDRLAREAVTLAETGDDVVFIGDALRDLAEVFRLAGMVNDQRVCLERALALYERKGAVRLVERTRAQLTELALET